MAASHAGNFRGSSIDGSALNASNHASCATSSASAGPTILVATRVTAARYRNTSRSKASKSPIIAATTRTSSGGSDLSSAIGALSASRKKPSTDIETHESQKDSSDTVNFLRSLRTRLYGEMTGKTYIGTSGWNYKHWLGPFYPEKFPAKNMLAFYAEHFDTVEINATHYHLPNFASFETWRKTVPEDFVFAVKASRFTTHMKKLKSPKASTEKFFVRVKRLRHKLGPILFQLPPR